MFDNVYLTRLKYQKLTAKIPVKIEIMAHDKVKNIWNSYIYNWLSAGLNIKVKILKSATLFNGFSEGLNVDTVQDRSIRSSYCVLNDGSFCKQ